MCIGFCRSGCGYCSCCCCRPSKQKGRTWTLWKLYSLDIPCETRHKVRPTKRVSKLWPRTLNLINYQTGFVHQGSGVSSELEFLRAFHAWGSSVRRMPAGLSFAGPRSSFVWFLSQMFFAKKLSSRSRSREPTESHCYTCSSATPSKQSSADCRDLQTRLHQRQDSLNVFVPPAAEWQDVQFLDIGGHKLVGQMYPVGSVLEFAKVFIQDHGQKAPVNECEIFDRLISIVGDLIFSGWYIDWYFPRDSKTSLSSQSNWIRFEGTVMRGRNNCSCSMQHVVGRRQKVLDLGIGAIRWVYIKTPWSQSN